MWPAPCSAAPPRATGRFLACAARCAASRFVFNDGTIRTIPEDREGQPAEQPAARWLGLDQRSPRHSLRQRRAAQQRQQYLGSQALITAAGAGVASLIESDSGRMSYVGSDGSIGTVGISGQESGRPDSGGRRAGTCRLWVNKLYGQAFAAVYVSGAKVAVHLESRSPSTSIPKAARSITAQEKAMLSNLNKLARGLALVLAVAAFRRLRHRQGKAADPR